MSQKAVPKGIRMVAKLERMRDNWKATQKGKLLVAKLGLWELRSVVLMVMMKDSLMAVMMVLKMVAQMS